MNYHKKDVLILYYTKNKKKEETKNLTEENRIHLKDSRDNNKFNTENSSVGRVWVLGA